MGSIYYFITVLTLCLMSYSANAETYSSGNQQVNLIELYTSEGCSACPPADEWLSSLQQKPGLWSEFIPLAFHVDYWDFIGWTDRFADKRYNKRQYHYANNDKLNAIYTPSILMNGKEWRRRPWSRLPNAKQKPLGKLDVTHTNSTLNAGFYSSMSKNQTLILNIALLGFEQISKIKIGENKGKQLEHNFVVLKFKTFAMQPSKNGFILNRTPFALPTDKEQRYALAAWISRIEDQTPLQATGGWLD